MESKTAGGVYCTGNVGTTETEEGEGERLWDGSKEEGRERA
jgi:hypothetical protein